MPPPRCGRHRTYLHRLPGRANCCRLCDCCLVPGLGRRLFFGSGGGYYRSHSPGSCRHHRPHWGICLQGAQEAQAQFRPFPRLCRSCGFLPAQAGCGRRNRNGATAHSRGTVEPTRHGADRRICFRCFTRTEERTRSTSAARGRERLRPRHGPKSFFPSLRLPPRHREAAAPTRGGFCRE